MVDSDYDSSCSSSLTVPDSSHISSRRSSISISSLYETPSVINTQKPHKQNQAAWEAMKSLRDQKGRVALDHFRLLRRLGSGDLGNVYLCQLRRNMNVNDLNNNTVLPNKESNSLYAMKVVDREALAIRKKLGRAETEREILGMLDHPFLPTLYAEFDASHYSCLVMEFCPGGDLHAARQRQIGKRFSIASSRFYAAETLLALEYLHMMGIVYRDLKPENVLIRSDGHIMLSDFDLSLKCDVVPKLIRSNKPETNEKTVCYIPSCATPLQSCFSSQNNKFKKCTTIVKTITTHVDDQVDQDGAMNNGDPEMVAEPINARSKSFVGTHEYLAPEVISGQGHGAAVDWWTLGIFLYELIYGTTPFKGENNEKTLVNILKQPLTFPKFGVSSSKEFEEVVKVQDLIIKLLVKNPKKRIGGLKGSVEIKRHDFFKGVNWALIRSVRPPDVPLRDHNNVNKVRGNAGNLVPKLSRKERDAPFKIPPHHFDYF